MRFRSMLLSLALLTFSTPAAADSGDAMGIGVGAQAMLTQTEVPAGAALTYDRGVFHVDAILGLSTIEHTTLLAAARAWYTIHRKASADLSLGGGAGIVHVDLDNDALDNPTVYQLEAGAKIRAFVVPNVALSAAVGFGLLAGDGEGFLLSGQFIGAFGVTYFLD